MTNTTRPPPDFNGIPRPHEARQGRSAIPIIYVGITTDVLILILISALQSSRIRTPLVAHRFANLVYLFIFFLLPYKEGVSYSIVLFFYQCLLDIGVTRVVSVQEVVPFLQDLCGKSSNQCLGNRVRGG